MESNNINEEKPKKSFNWGFLYKVYLFVLIVVFIFAWANKADAVEGSFDSVYSYILENPEINLADAMGDQTAYEAFKDWSYTTHGMTLPEWGDAASPSTQVQDYFRNVASGFIGQYAIPDSQTLTSLIGTYEDLEDILQFLTFDTNSGEYIVRSNDRAGLLGEINHTIYVAGQTSVGSWRLMDQTIYYPYYGRNYPLTTSSSYDVWVCIVREDYNNQNRWILWSSKDPDFRSTLSGYGLSSVTNTYTANGNTYYWVLGNQMYSAAGLRWESSSGPECGVYSNHSTALAALWGSGEPSADPQLTGAIIVDEDPTFTSMSLPSSLYYDYSTTIVNKYEDDDNTPIPNNIYNFQPYVTTYDVPQWLSDPSVEFPDEPDYLANLEIEQPDFESDPTFIQSVYESLPSGIILMISISLGLGVVIRIIS